MRKAIENLQVLKNTQNKWRESEYGSSFLQKKERYYFGNLGASWTYKSHVIALYVFKLFEMTKSCVPAATSTSLAVQE